ncbi:DUF262 domain-containing protein [Vibrio vulnificus]|uniref:DUF262 domain-containing protein n=1 Tax=Vibrio cidicii TaxID=1763883 RepID=UPI00077FE64B|nr:DUF262 domain-containing protein [Vibrio cidicii]KYN87607.1 hypothetical protein ATY36_00130 [Vibrio cidicii]MCU8562257.1 DUF262 domain-containing protein [Vibrio vulnificus]
MQGNLSIKGITVQNIYTQYLAGNFVINRRYQRKLVWSIEEKEKFIDSLMNSFPIPMIITASHRKSDGTNASEILDGMQRLNAITSFIEGEFPVNGKYFNLSAVAQTKRKLDAGKLKQNSPMLDLDSCSLVLDYPVPFSVCDTNEPKKIDESFRRINTGGRTLSLQDVRQAGSLGIIPDIIRDAAIYIRKDSSRTSILDLSNMKNISLSNKGLSYGIKLENIFWVKHSIITYENVRKSRDEELVAHLLAYIASKDGAVTTSGYLDAIYDSNSDESKDLQRKINKQGYDTVYKHFCIVFDELSKVLDYCDSSFSKLAYSGKATKIKLVFQVVFIAFYKAIIESNLKVGNYKNLCNSLNNIYDSHLTAIDNDKAWNSKTREKLSNAIFGVIKEHFSARSGVDRNLSNWVENLENILNESQTEQVCYDFKMGLNKIVDGSGDFQAKTLSRIIKTLVAMTNTKVGDCYVILGVADNESDAKLHEKHYKSSYINHGHFSIVGIDREASKYHGDLDKYMKKIIDLVDKEPISPYFKNIIKSHMVPFTYSDKEIFLFKAFRGDKPEMYAEKYVKRTLSHNEQIPPEELFDFFEFFKTESSLAQKI